MKLFALLPAIALLSLADDGQPLLSVDHYVGVKSTVPAIAGQRTAAQSRKLHAYYLESEAPEPARASRVRLLRLRGERERLV